MPSAEQKNQTDMLVNQLFSSFSWLVLEHNTCGRVHGAGFEVSFPVPTDEFAEPLAPVQNSNLCPKIHESVGGRCAGQPDPPFHERSDFPQVLEPLGLIILEG